MDTSEHILSLVSRFPHGIRGCDIRFALQVSQNDFAPMIQQVLVNQDVTVDTIEDFEQGHFKLNSNLYFPDVEKHEVSAVLIDVHKTLQQFPKGLTVRELCNRTHHPEVDVQMVINDSLTLNFMVESTDQSFHTRYQTCIQEPILRLVAQEENVQLPVVAKKKVLWTIGAIGTLIASILGWFW